MVQKVRFDEVFIDEEWRPAPGYPRYEVSNYGRIKSLPTYRKTHPNKRAYFIPEFYLKPQKRNKFGRIGYFQLAVSLIKEWKVSKVEIIARLMLTAFVRPPKPGEVARHLDDNPANNVLSNLAWGYRKDNAADAVRNGRIGRGENHPRSRLYQLAKSNNSLLSL